jgi:hypothetical protein
MNDSDKSFPDEMLSDMLAPLRDASVPEDVRAANREAIARALARHTRAPWWRRSVAVPLPLAIAATVAIITASIALLLPAAATPTANNSADRQAQDQLALKGVMVEFVQPDSMPPRWSISRSYINSVESLATTRVPVDSDL